MKRSRFIEIVREEIRAQLEAYGSEQIYFTPSGFEQMQRAPERLVKRFENPEKWKIYAMQLGATIQDRGDDWIAVMPNQDKIGTFSKMNQYGTITV